MWNSNGYHEKKTKQAKCWVVKMGTRLVICDSCNADNHKKCIEYIPTDRPMDDIICTCSICNCVMDDVMAEQLISVWIHNIRK
jgi:hypothetical protein